MKIEKLILAYGLICVAMIIFNFVCVLVFKHEDKKRKNQRFAEKIYDQFDRLFDHQEVTKKHVNEMKRKCRSIRYLMTLDETLSLIVKVEEPTVKEYLNQMQSVFLSLTVEYYQKDPIYSAYFAYFMAKYNICQHQQMNGFAETFLHYLKKDSLYCKQNTMRIFYGMGVVDYVIQALTILNDQMSFFHIKILADGLLTFEGNHHELISQLWKHFETFHVNMQLAILNYIRFKSGDYCEKMMEILKNPAIDRELHFAAIRYFGKYTYLPAQQVLIDYVSNPDVTLWEYAAFSATALAKYDSLETIDALKQACGSSNWYIRSNAAMSLNELGLTYSDVLDIVHGDDRYAREILMYYFTKRNQRKELF